MRRSTLFFLFVYCSITVKAQIHLCGADKNFAGNATFYTPPSKPTLTVQYASVNNSFDFPLRNTTIKLYMDIYTDTNHAGNKPVILLMHGGGFRVGCKDDGSMADLCKEFVRRGFVAVGVNYRLGWVDDTVSCVDKGVLVTDNGDNNNLLLDESCVNAKTRSGTGTTGTCSFCESSLQTQRDSAVYRAVQDVNAALRFIKHYATPLQIDTNNIFIGGNSAGAIAAVNAAYMQQPDMDAQYGTGFKTALGLIDSSGVDSISNTILHDKVTIKGIFNDWGAVLDTNYIQDQPADRIPIISFHGRCDPVVPYLSGHANSCSAYDSLFGSKAIYIRFQNFTTHVSHVLYSRPGGHGIYEDCDSGLIERVICATKFFTLVNLNTYRNDSSECIHRYCPKDTGSCAICSSDPHATNLNLKTLQDIRVYPNPAHGSVYCSYRLTENSFVTMEVFNALGTSVYYDKRKKQAGSYTQQVAIKLLAGTYHFKLSTGKDTYITVVLSE